MQSGNLEIVRATIDALNRGDVDGVLACMDAAFEWATLDHSPVAGTYRGHDEVRHYVEDWLGHFDELRLDVEDLSEHGDQVVAVVRSQVRGRASGVELGSGFCQLWTLRDGRAIRMQEHPTREEALAAIG